MKIEIAISPEDRQAVAREVVALLRPLLKGNRKADTENSIFDVKGLADYLHVDKSWIYKQVSIGAIPHFKLGKYVRFRKSAVDIWAESRAVKAAPNLEKGWEAR